MHSSVHQFFYDHATSRLYSGKRVLEVGSLDVNGSVRELISTYNPAEYIGVDMIKGKGVDVVLEAEKLVEQFGRRSFDTVVSTEMLEHALNWRECVNVMKDVARRWLVITTRSPGFPWHGFPDDHWRFTLDDFTQIFADCVIHRLEDDPEAPGVFLLAEKTRRRRVDLSTIEIGAAPVR